MLLSSIGIKEPSCSTLFCLAPKVFLIFTIVVTSNSHSTIMKPVHISTALALAAQGIAATNANMFMGPMEQLAPLSQLRRLVYLKRL
jgi:hypothetical protein